MIEVVSLHPRAPDPAVLARAGALLREGELVAFPSETVYGLGADATSERAVRRIYEAKGRPERNPVIVHVAAAEEARDLSADWPEVAARLADAFWPGPLTVVVRRGPSVPDAVTAGRATVGFRCPSHPVAMGLIRAAGRPLAAPSANRSFSVSPTRAEHVVRSFGLMEDSAAPTNRARVSLVLDAGPASGGIESTVIDVTGAVPRILRPGLVTLAELRQVIGTVEAPGIMLRPDDGVSALPAPGMLERHYATRARIELAPLDGSAEVRGWLDQGRMVGWMTWAAAEEIESPRVRRIDIPTDPREFAALLYDAMIRLDDQGVDRIVVAALPLEEDWMGIRDRLARASVSA